MIELLELILAALIHAMRSRQCPLLENLLLRQQLQVAFRCCQRRPASAAVTSSYGSSSGRLHRNWRRHLLLVRPETVLRWHRQGWRLFWQVSR